MIKVYDWREVGDLLTEIAASKPEGFCYVSDSGSCLYFRDGEPDCIIGHLLHRLGVTKEMLGLQDAHYIHQICSLDPDRSNKLVRAMFTEAAVLLMTEVQRDQDAGVPWRAAVAAALRKMADPGNAGYVAAAW